MSLFSAYSGQVAEAKALTRGSERCTPDYEAMITNLDNQVGALAKFTEGVEAMEEIDGRPCDELCAAYGKAVLIKRGMIRNRATLMSAWEAEQKK